MLNYCRYINLFFSFHWKRILIAIFCFALLSSCSKQTNHPHFKIGFSQCVGADLWRRTMLEEMRIELSLHPGAEFIYKDADNNSEIQIRQVKQLLAEDIDLLIISPNEARPLTPIVEEAFSKGIPVIVIDRKTSSNLYTAYVGSNNYEIGKLAGDYLGRTVKTNASVMEILGLPGSSPTIERQKGFSDALKKYPNLHLDKQLYCNWLKDTTKKKLLQISNELKNTDIVFAHNDMMALGAKEVFKSLNLDRNMKFIGVDASPGAGGGLQLIASKQLNASMLYPPGVKDAIRTAFSILNKTSFNKESIQPTLVIDSSNVQLMQIQWDRISSQQNDIERQQTLLAEQQKVYNSQRVILNIIVITMVVAIVFGGLAFFLLNENRKTNKKLEAKNHEILSQRNQLIEMSAKAEVATEAKLNFFTNISHEFRTPLTLILLPLEDLIAQIKTDSVQSKNLRLIHKNVIRLLRYVNQLIEYRKIEYDKLKIKATENNLVPFVKEIVDSFNDMAVKNNINLQFTSFTNSVMVWFDVNMLDKVIFNLLSNAFKFTKNNGLIKVSIKKPQEADEISIEVEDNGIGMTEESVVHAFDMFYQADSYSFKGSGLGLSLSKEFMNLHKGSLNVKSKKGQGTTFTIKLRTGDSHLLEDEKYTHKDQIENIYEQEKIYNITPEELPILQNKPADGLIKEQSILIIEDNTDLLAYLTSKFETDYEVFATTNGNDGFNLAFEKIPDLIISDVVLPELSGKEITNKLKTDIRTSHIPIILLTAKGSLEQQIEGIRNKADAYIVKPFNFDYLLENVRNLLNNRQLLKEHYSSEYPVGNKVPISKKLDKKFLNEFSGIVEANLSNEKFTVDDICKNIGISRIQLYRKVKALLGCTITDYILSRRLQKAKYLLTNEDLSIAEITYQTGFASPTYFSTVFKGKYGCTPSEYKRKQHS
jgi:signal transduction histidine kinase/DNA-binding response OmpR family regulator